MEQRSPSGRATPALRYASTAFLSRTGLGVVQKDAPHSLGGGRVEMSLVRPRDSSGVDQAQICLVEESSCLEGVVSTLLGHVLLGDRPKLFVNKGQQLVCGLRIGTLNLLQDKCDFAHALSCAQAWRRQAAEIPSYLRMPCRAA